MTFGLSTSDVSYLKEDGSDVLDTLPDVTTDNNFNDGLLNSDTIP